MKKKKPIAGLLKGKVSVGDFLKDRKGFKRKLPVNRLLEKFLKKSELDEKESEEIGHKIKHEIRKRLWERRQTLQKTTGDSGMENRRHRKTPVKKKRLSDLIGSLKDKTKKSAKQIMKEINEGWG